MWQLLAIVIGGVLLFYWIAFYISVVAWLNAIGHLLGGNFIRASIYFSIGSGLLFWWMSADIDFDTWLHGSAVIVGIGMLATFVRWRKKQQAMQTIPAIPTWTPPKAAANDNQLVTFSLHAKHEG